MSSRDNEHQQREKVLRALREDARLHTAAVDRFGELRADYIWSRVPTYDLTALIDEHKAGDCIMQVATVNEIPPSTPAEVLTHPVLAGMEQSFSLDNLTAADRVVLLKHVRSTHMALPTEHGTLEQWLEATGMTPVALWASCRDTTNIPLMIAAAALRHVTRLPDDPRLDPEPHSPAPVKSPRSDAEAARKPRQVIAKASSSGEYLASFVPNPKRKGTAAWDRYALYVVGMTKAQLRERGCTASDFRYDTEHGFVTWSDTPPEAQS